MTDTIETSTAEQDARVLDAARGIAQGQAVDIDAVTDVPSIQAALTGIGRERNRWMNLNGDAAAGQAMALAKLHTVTTAIDAVRAPFARLDELAAAEQEVQRREQAGRDALAELEAAVKAGDVEKVMRLRGEVEVGKPRQLAEARKALLRLQIEQEEARVRPAEIREVQARIVETEAKQRIIALTSELQQAQADLRAAEQATRGMQAGREQLSAQLAERQAELSDLESNHDREMQARLRRIAGLAEPVEAAEPEPGPAARSLVGHQINPVAPDFRADGPPPRRTPDHVQRFIDAPYMGE